MYQAQASGALLANRRKLLDGQRSWVRVGRTVFLLGVTSLLTDISAEMVSTTLPLYLLVTLRFSPFQVGFLDGLYQGAAVIANVISGFAADRWKKPKEVAATGYGFSALCKLLFLVVGRSWTGISAAILLDRTGKGIRTAPRDAMIAATTAPEERGIAFGVHRAMDTAGAMLGPLLAVAILAVAPEAYDAIFVVSLCVAFIGLLVIVLFIDNPRPDAAPAARVDSAAISWRDAVALLREVDFRNVLILGSALGIVTVSDNLVYLTLKSRIAIPAALFPLQYVVTALIFMVFAIPVGKLADRIGHRLVFLFGYGLLAAAYAVLLSPIGGGAAAAVVFVCLGLFHAATDGILAALASGTLPPHLRTTGLSILTTGTGLAQFVSSTMFGLVWGTAGPEAALIAFVAALIVVLAVTAVTIRRVARD